MQVSKVANFINHSKFTQKALRWVSDNPALFSTVTSFAIATTIRPATTIAITKDKTDGIYGAASSIASAVVEIIAGLILLKPMGNLIAKSSKELYNSAGTIYYKNPDMLRRYKSISNRGYKMPTLIVTSMLRFGLVHPTRLLLEKLGISKGNRNIKKGVNLKA